MSYLSKELSLVLCSTGECEESLHPVTPDPEDEAVSRSQWHSQQALWITGMRNVLAANSGPLAERRREARRSGIRAVKKSPEYVEHVFLNLFVWTQWGPKGAIGPYRAPKGPTVTSFRF